MRESSQNTGSCQCRRFVAAAADVARPWPIAVHIVFRNRSVATLKGRATAGLKPRPTWTYASESIDRRAVPVARYTAGLKPRPTLK